MSVSATASAFVDLMNLPPVDPSESAGWGKRIGRTMHLLESSSPRDRRKVRILFYGQSITGGCWHRHVEEELRRRYPFADLEVENRALGGYSAQYLVRTAEHDLYPWYPDLIVFHVYGDHRRYEEIIRAIRARTTAEIMLFNDHWNRKEYDQGEWRMKRHSAFMHDFLPQLADAYQCEFVDVRNPWRAYLEMHGLTPGDLLRDNVHLNEHGLKLMASLCSRQMAPADYRPDDAVRDYIVGEDLDWEDGVLRLEFDGNRVDVIEGEQESGTSVAVLVDDHSPSHFREAYAVSRPGALVDPLVWPAVNRISLGTPLPRREEWHAEILEISDDHEDVRFRVVGSITGPDGEGSSRERFVSDSGRILIEPGDWNLARSYKLKQVPVKPGMKFRWNVYPLHHDFYIPSTARGLLSEAATTLFHGIENGHHHLELHAEGRPPSIKALRVFRPPLDLAAVAALSAGDEPDDLSEDHEINRPPTDPAP